MVSVWTRGGGRVQDQLSRMVCWVKSAQGTEQGARAAAGCVCVREGGAAPSTRPGSLTPRSPPKPLPSGKRPDGTERTVLSPCARGLVAERSGRRRGVCAESPPTRWRQETCASLRAPGSAGPPRRAGGLARGRGAGAGAAGAAGAGADLLTSKGARPWEAHPRGVPTAARRLSRTPSPGEWVDKRALPSDAPDASCS